MNDSGQPTATKIPAYPNLLRWPLLWLFIAITLVTAATGYFMFRYHQADFRQNETALLGTVADAKVELITKWKVERLGDADIFRQGSFLPGEVAKWLQRGAPSGASMQKILEQMHLVRRAYDYQALFLFDTHGKLMLSAPPGAVPPDASGMALVRVAVDTQAVTFLDTDTHTESHEMGMIAPLLVMHDGKNQTAGVMYMQIDQGHFLAPLLYESSRYRSLEVVMAHHHGNELVLLTVTSGAERHLQIRHLPLDQPGLPAAIALSGTYGGFEGVDYRGVPVFAALHKIPDSDWALVVKVDQEEAYAPLHKLAWLMAGAIAALLILIWILAGLWWRTQRAGLLADRHKLMEEEMRRLNAVLEQRITTRTAQLEAANQELESFAYSVSHDLRTPLRAIDGFSQLLLKKHSASLNQEGQRLLNVIRDNTARMGRLIDDILAFSRTGRLEMQTTQVNMTELAHEAWQELAPLLANREVHLDVKPLPQVQGDAAMLRQVFANLLGNAVKFTNTRAVANIEVSGSVQDGECIFYVKDNGVGFDPQYVHKLFGVFQRLHGIDEFDGTGIGLAIIKRIVTRHGGRVWAEGKVNEGATAYFALPHNAPQQDTH